MVKRIKPRLAITVDKEVVEWVEVQARSQHLKASQFLNQVLLRDAERWKAGVEKNWDVRHMQIVLDMSKTVEEVKDLVYTVLERGWSFDWSDKIEVCGPNLEPLKRAIKDRLKEIREVKR